MHFSSHNDHTELHILLMARRSARPFIHDQPCVFSEKVSGTWRRLGSLQQNKVKAGGGKPLFSACCHTLSWNSICSLTGMKWDWLLAQMSSRRERMGNEAKEKWKKKQGRMERNKGRRQTGWKKRQVDRYWKENKTGGEERSAGKVQGFSNLF